MRFATLAATALATLALALPASALTIDAKVSPEFQKKLDDDIGAREAATLTEAVTRKVTDVFTARGIQADRVEVTIEDARPNRPTFEQVSNKPGLDSMRSISIGGAKVSGVAFDASGREIGRLNYNWYENDLSNVLGNATWTDARTTFARFANRFADKLS